MFRTMLKSFATDTLALVVQGAEQRGCRARQGGRVREQCLLRGGRHPQLPNLRPLHTRLHVRHR